MERINENGVEVVINHLEPYNLGDEPTSLTLTREFEIDVESKEAASLGLANIGYFDIDSQGNIFIASSKSKDPILFKYDNAGNFISSFGRMGQGPGEVQFIRFFGIDSLDRVIISDHTSKKVLFFNAAGTLIREVAYNPDFFTMFPLENGYFVFVQDVIKPEEEELSRNIRICNADFKDRKELDSHISPSISDGMPVLYPVFLWRLSGERLFTVNEQRGYEILEYDLVGNLVRKVRKEYIQVRFPDELKQKYIKRYGTARKLYFPKYLPPFRSFFCDDQNRLYVMTQEEGDHPGEYMFDVFNRHGVFVSRISLNVLLNWDLQAKSKKGYLYCVQEKESGFMKLVAYRMIWD